MKLQNDGASALGLRRRPGAVALLSVLMAMPLACTSATTGTTCNKSSQISAQATASVLDSGGKALAEQYAIDGSVAAKAELGFRIANTASVNTAAPLTIKSVTLVETDLEGGAISSPVFSCTGGTGDTDCSSTNWPALLPAGFDTACAPAGASYASVPLTIHYLRGTVAQKRKVTVSVSVDGDPTIKKPFTFTVFTQAGVPHMKCAPEEVDFGSVAVTETNVPTQPVNCTNTGNGDLIIDQLGLFSSNGLPITVTAETYTFEPSQTTQVLQPVLTIAPGTSLKIVAALGAIKTANPGSASLQLHSNDTAKASQIINFKVNSTGPCLMADWKDQELTTNVGTPVQRLVTFSSCGSEAASITDIGFDAASAAGFSVQSAGGCLAAGDMPSALKPLTMPPGASCSFYVVFSPPQAVQGAKGTLVVTWNGDPRSLSVSGSATQSACPVACFTISAVEQISGQVIAEVKDGDAVVPQTELTMDPNCSTAIDPHVVKTIQFSIKNKPNGSFTTFQPSASVIKLGSNPAPKVKLVVNNAGKYTIRMDMKDEAGTPACAPAIRDVIVVPDDMLHVELTWDTPGDPTKTDTGLLPGTTTPVGSDMDLHLAHPDALKVTKPAQYQNGKEDPFFVKCYDCFTVNNVTQWGDLNSKDDDAHIDLDDWDGWGPENINIHTPEENIFYFIGVHYYNDSKYGPSTPHINVYLNAKPDPSLSMDGPSMVIHDLWCAQRVSVSTKAFAFEPCTGGTTQSGGPLIKAYKFDTTPANGYACPP